MAILVTGGAGYIGGATVELLLSKGFEVVILDNLVHGHRPAVDAGVPFYQGNIEDGDLIKQIVDQYKIEDCIHFAAYAYVGESVEEPSKYFNNNVAQGVKMLDALIASGVKNVVFSSTCATYGEPIELPIDESHPQNPTNPYGWSKFFMERILESYDRAYGLKFIALRYFNAAGATEKLGEHHDPETHLIPNVLKAAAGKLPSVSIFGNDYPTPDGTCIRDYIHILDLAEAHIRALKFLKAGGGSTAFNLGNGHGFSVLQVIEAARKVTGQRIEIRYEPRREGDPSRLIADAGKAFALLGWKPKHADLESIIGSAWRWQIAHPDGYHD